jgi:hypothetical protein
MHIYAKGNKKVLKIEWEWSTLTMFFHAIYRDYLHLYNTGIKHAGIMWPDMTRTIVHCAGWMVCEYENILLHCIPAP